MNEFRAELGGSDGSSLLDESKWTVPGLPTLVIPAAKGGYLDGVVAAVVNGTTLGIRLLDTQKVLDKMKEVMSHHDQPVIVNPRKNQLGIVQLGPRKTWYRVLVLDRTSATDLKVYLLDYATSETVDVNAVYQMPTDLMKFAPMAFPLSLNGKSVRGIRRDELDILLKNAKTTFKLGPSTSKNSSTFGGEEVNLYDKTTKELVPLREASNHGAVIEKTDYKNVFERSLDNYDYAKSSSMPPPTTTLLTSTPRPATREGVTYDYSFEANALPWGLGILSVSLVLCAAAVAGFSWYSERRYQAKKRAKEIQTKREETDKAIAAVLGPTTEPDADAEANASASERAGGGSSADCEPPEPVDSTANVHLPEDGKDWTKSALSESKQTAVKMMEDNEVSNKPANTCEQPSVTAVDLPDPIPLSHNAVASIAGLMALASIQVDAALSDPTQSGITDGTQLTTSSPYKTGKGNSSRIGSRLGKYWNKGHDPNNKFDSSSMIITARSRSKASPNMNTTQEVNSPSVVTAPKASEREINRLAAGRNNMVWTPRDSTDTQTHGKDSFVPMRSRAEATFVVENEKKRRSQSSNVKGQVKEKDNRQKDTNVDLNERVDSVHTTASIEDVTDISSGRIHSNQWVVSKASSYSSHFDVTFSGPTVPVASVHPSDFEAPRFEDIDRMLGSCMDASFVFPRQSTPLCEKLEMERSKQYKKLKEQSRQFEILSDGEVVDLPPSVSQIDVRSRNATGYYGSSPSDVVRSRTMGWVIEGDDPDMKQLEEERAHIDRRFNISQFGEDSTQPSPKSMPTKNTASTQPDSTMESVESSSTSSEGSKASESVASSHNSSYHSAAGHPRPAAVPNTPNDVVIHF